MSDQVDDDDGFNVPPSNRGNNYFRYDEDKDWRDRDGVPPKPEATFVAIKIGECAIGWFDERQRVIPRPFDLDTLNKEIPVEDWPTNPFTGNPEPPYKAGIFVLLVDPETGATYKYVHHTTGARMAYDDILEETATVRKLRGENVYPVVRLRDKPFRKRGGIWGKRPHFENAGWKLPGHQLPPAPSSPQLTAPAQPTLPAPAQSTPSSASPASPTKEPRPHPIPALETKPASAKRPVTLTNYTKAVMTGAPPVPGMVDVPPPTTEELLDDSLDDMAWDTEPKQQRS